MGISDGMFTGDLQRRMAAVERELRNLTSGRRLEDASIGARGLRLLEGGSLTISGGSLIMHDETGSVGLLYFGPNSAGQPTWVFSFDDGEVAGGLLGAPGSMHWSWLDRGGRELIGNDGLTGVGLARPYLPYRLVPSFEAEGVGEGAASLWPSTTSTSATKLMQGLNPIWHPRVSIGVATATIGDGNVEWRLDIDGVTAASGTGTGEETVAIPGWGEEDGINPGDTVGFDLYAWCTGGATRAWIQCDRLYGRQS
ncbi:hypothetical protein [Glycomyces arizonensis]|uniref:hypothetical protein n=1 Tax=Glycomyces arizonensis TaxID=256035 RepID=UPI000404ED5C|nr:hypothetical protein [Glycomyces arizonensis]